MDWVNVAEVIVGGLILFVLSRAVSYWEVIVLPFVKKKEMLLEWVCFVRRLPHPGYEHLYSSYSFSSDLPLKEFEYSVKRLEHFIPLGVEDGCWAIPRGMGSKIEPPGNYRQVEYLEEYAKIKLYDRNPLFGKKPARLGYGFVRWRNARLIKRFYENISETERDGLAKNVAQRKVAAVNRFQDAMSPGGYSFFPPGVRVSAGEVAEEAAKVKEVMRTVFDKRKSRCRILVSRLSAMVRGLRRK